MKRGWLKQIPACAGITVLLWFEPAFAQAQSGAEIYAQGNDNGVLPCAACHGAKAQGNSAVGAPKLAGLPASVIKTALAQIAQSDGGNGAMRHVAQALSPAETGAVADYLANLK